MQSPKSRIPSEQITSAVASPTHPQVLVIDDDQDGVEIITLALELIGVTTLIAGDGTSGLSMALTFQPNLILLDITLPDLDGFEVLQQLRRQPATDQIPVIAVTAMAMVEEQEQIEAAGFGDYLIKPFLLEDLYAKIYRYLDA